MATAEPGNLRAFLRKVAVERRLGAELGGTEAVHDEAKGSVRPKISVYVPSEEKQAIVRDGKRYLSLGQSPEGEPQYKEIKEAWRTWKGDFYGKKTPDALTW
mmetsp:Transcript_33913/g.78870  ORF Transcript_33913/g.78870 Transcript_33913/m.78870 type:complete len:102 (-) Transcript_33913:94-399(-)|eukprot:CAMPEP_0171093340 /NCGR_PEP_ID=MMETSP0766_2-20121228/39023_1 /TAXON_ID=439317 /ORGANISM="Gambierdiscus australes, Strain CAWD 149" /LENGTH=101 /DNA_ID=CAMNT_0011551771 /DNA_START=80 /DNA_END=385 /DNA_ORIENTATION=+